MCVSLKSLETLFIYGNSLTGVIPESIGKLTSMRKFDIHQNGISGTIPDSIGSMTAINTLSLFGNELEGPIPDISNLQELKILDIHNSNIGDSLPIGIFTLPNLGKHEW